MDDLLILAGFIALLIGTYQINPVCTWFVGAAECFIAAFLIAWSNRPS
jgi:hypothetical protein